MERSAQSTTPRVVHARPPSIKDTVHPKEPRVARCTSHLECREAIWCQPTLAASVIAGGGSALPEDVDFEAFVGRSEH